MNELIAVLIMLTIGGVAWAGYRTYCRYEEVLEVVCQILIMLGILLTALFLVGMAVWGVYGVVLQGVTQWTVGL